MLWFEGEERRPVPASCSSCGRGFAARVGIDRAPIDVTSEARRSAAALVRLGRAGRAAAAARPGDRGACVPTRRSSSAATTSRSFPRCWPALPDDGLTVVFQTASFGYIGDEGRARVRVGARGSGRGAAARVHLDGQAARSRGGLLGPAPRLLARRRARVRGPRRLPRRLAAVGAVITSAHNPKLRLDPSPARVAASAREGRTVRGRGRGSRAGGGRRGYRAGRAAAGGRGRRGGAAGEGLDDGASAARDGDLPAGALPRGVEPVSLALWHVADPGNLGTILRTADAFGASVALSRRLRRSHRPEGGARLGRRRLPRSARRFRRAWGTRVALVSHGGPPLAELDPGVPVTYVLGAEREGLPDDVVAACDETATIPLAPGAESLNVAIAGAIALYEHRRRR